MKSKLIMAFAFIFIACLVCNVCNAFTFDNVKQFDITKGKYGELSIINAFGLGDKIMNMRLTDYSDSVINAYAYGEADLYQDGKIIAGIEFEGLNKKSAQMRNVKYYIEKEIIYYEGTPINEKRCYNVETKDNKTEEIKIVQECRNIIADTRMDLKKRKEWVAYNFETLKAGSYKFKIEATKLYPNQKVDFILKTDFGGFKTTEWAWWNTEFKYKQKVLTQDTLGYKFTNYTIKLNITYDANMQADFDDIRFTDEAQANELSYYIQQKTDSNYAWAWIRIPETSGAYLNTTIYMYYGNSSVSTTSDKAGVRNIWNENLSAYYAFDSQATIGTDLSPSGNNFGTITNANTTYGILNNSLLINKSEATNSRLGESGINNLTLGINNFVIAFWINISPIYWDGTTSFSKVFFGLQGDTWLNNGVLQSYIDRGNTTLYIAGGNVLQCKTANMNNSQWYRVVYVRNGTGTNQASCYINGVLSNAGDLPDDITCPDNEIRISYVTDANIIGHGLTNITLDDFRIYNNKSWNLQDVVDDYNYGAGTSYAQQPIIYFGEGTSDLTELSQTYNPTTYEGNNEYFNISIEYKTSDWSSISADLIYIDSAYSGTQVGTGDYIGFARTISIPLNTADYQNNTFYWRFKLTNATGDYYKNSTLHNQTSYKSQIVDEFNSVASSLSVQSFRANVSYSSTYYQNAISWFYYNGTTYSGNLESSTTNFARFSRSVNVPSTTTYQNYTFYWTIQLVNSSGFSTYINSTIRNQTITPILVDNCTENSNLIMNYTFYDENSMEFLDGSVKNISFEVDLKFGDSYNINIKRNQTNPILICSNMSVSGLRLDAQARYSATDYIYRFNNIQNYTMTSTALNMPLLMLPITDSQSFLTTYKDEGFLPVENAVIEINRKYIGENLYRLVESPITDSSGQTITHLVLEDVIYQAIVKKEGQILKVFDNVMAICQNPTTNTCTLSLYAYEGGTEPDDFETIGDLSYSMSFNSTSRTARLIFSTISGASQNVVLNITSANYSNQELCSNSLIAPSGTLICVVPSSFGNGTIISSVYSAGNWILSNYYSIISDIKEKTTPFGVMGYLMAFILYMTLVLMMISSPVMIIVGAILGLIIAALLMIINVSMFIKGAVIGWFIIAGILIIWKIGQGRTPA